MQRGGGCFLHYDNAGAVAPPADSTILLEPAVALSDGGELELYPWLAPPVSVPPLYGRLVLFRHPSSPAQRILSRAVYAEEYAASIREFPRDTRADGDGARVADGTLSSRWRAAPPCAPCARGACVSRLTGDSSRRTAAASRWRRSISSVPLRSTGR